MEKLIALMRQLPLADLGELMAVLAQKVRDHRSQHHGLVPLEVFEHCCVIGGATICFELIVRTPSGFLLKRRGEIEQGWNGFYHIPGCLIRPGDTEVLVKQRLLEEVFGHRAQYFADRLRYVGTDVRADNKERGGNCTSVLWIIDIADDEVLALVSGEWKTITPTKLADTLPEEVSGWVIHFHWRTLQRIFSSDGDSIPTVHIQV